MSLDKPQAEETPKSNLAQDNPGCDYAVVLLERHKRGMKYSKVVSSIETEEEAILRDAMEGRR